MSPRLAAASVSIGVPLCYFYLPRCYYSQAYYDPDVAGAVNAAEEGGDAAVATAVDCY